MFGFIDKIIEYKDGKLREKYTKEGLKEDIELLYKDLFILIEEKKEYEYDYECLVKGYDTDLIDNYNNRSNLKCDIQRLEYKIDFMKNTINVNLNILSRL